MKRRLIPKPSFRRKRPAGSAFGVPESRKTKLLNTGSRRCDE
jgi:hypothetical protein